MNRSDSKFGWSLGHWSLGKDNNTLTMYGDTLKSVNSNFDPEINSTLSSEGILEKKSAWKSFQKNVGRMWLTKQMIPKDADKCSIIKTTLRELLVYCTFLATITYITFQMMNPTMYYQTKVMSELFLDKQFSDGSGISYKTASQISHFWKFAESSLIDGLYWDKWYNNETTSVEYSILYENYLLGSPRIRQLRVRNDSCEVHKDFRAAISECYNTYAEYYEDIKPLKPFNETGSVWTEIKSFAKNDVWGQIATYSGKGGYIVDLSLNKSSAIATIKALKSNLWIDRGTRVVFIDFTTYNPNVNLFVVTKLISEFPATGGMLTSWQFRTLNLLENTKNSIVLYFCFILFTFFVIYYTIEELIEIKQLGFCVYIKDSGWNVIDILSIIISVALIFFSIYRKYVINLIFVDSDPDDDTQMLMNSSMSGMQMETYQFDTLGFWSAQFSNMLALLAFIAWVKLFKYISFNKTMSQLSSTLSRCAKDIAGFGVMFFIVFFAFAQLGYLLFGTQVKDYSTFGTAIFTLLRLILGDFDFRALEAANRVLGPVFFLSYIFFVFFVLMNMFLAIINDTYSEVKAEITDDNDFAVMDYFKNISNGFMTKLGKQRDQIEGIQQAIIDSGIDGSKKLSFEAVRHELKKRDLSDQEIEMLFAKYDLDQNRELDASELKAMIEDLEGKKKLIDKEIQEEAKNVRPDSARSAVGVHVRHGGGDNSKLIRRVDRMEYTLSIISSKIDSVLAGKIVLGKNDDIKPMTEEDY